MLHFSHAHKSQKGKGVKEKLSKENIWHCEESRADCTRDM